MRGGALRRGPAIARLLGGQKTSDASLCARSMAEILVIDAAGRLYHSPSQEDRTSCSNLYRSFWQYRFLVF